MWRPTRNHVGTGIFDIEMLKDPVLLDSDASSLEAMKVNHITRAICAPSLERIHLEIDGMKRYGRTNASQESDTRK